MGIGNRVVVSIKASNEVDQHEDNWHGLDAVEVILVMHNCVVRENDIHLYSRGLLLLEVLIIKVDTHEIGKHMQVHVTKDIIKILLVTNVILHTVFIVTIKRGI